MSYKFLPSTFERRGVALHFDRKILRFARLRLDDPADQMRWHILLPNHGVARRGAVAIIPWLQLPQFTDMSPRDEALRNALAKVRVPTDLPEPAIDPIMLRAVMLRVDNEAGATPERQAEAQRELELDKLIRATVRLHLFANLVQEFAKDISDDVLTNMNGKMYRQLSGVAKNDPSLKAMLDRFAGKVVNHAAEGLNLRPEILLRRLEDLTDLITPLAKVDLEEINPGAQIKDDFDAISMEDGYLRRARRALRWLHMEMDAFLVNAREELRYPLEMILFSIDQFLQAVEGPFEEVEAEIERISQALTRYDVVRPRMVAARYSMAWALDGWNSMVNIWRTTLKQVSESELDPDGRMQVEDIIALERAINTIFMNMPSMPNSQVCAIQARLEAWSHFEHARAKAIQAGLDWNQSRPDPEVLDRIHRARVTA